MAPRRPRSTTFPRVPARAGFSLVELMVVIVIISILASLLLGGMTVAREGVRASKTAATIRKISETILSYYEEYPDRLPSMPVWSAGGAPIPSRFGPELYDAASRIAIRRLMALELPDQAQDLDPRLRTSGSARRQASSIYPGYGLTVGEPPYSTEQWPVPRNANERWRLFEVPPTARRYVYLVDDAAASAGVSVDRLAELIDSAEFLYLIVMRGGLTDADLAASFNPDEVGDTDKDGLLEFIDAWRRPIRFCRWPVGLDSPLQPVAAEQDDFFGTAGNRLVPLIYSAGSNGEYDVEVVRMRDNAGDYVKHNYDPFRATQDFEAQSLSAIGRDDVTNHDLIR